MSVASRSSGPTPAVRAAIGLGSSLGDRLAHLEVAIRRLAAHPDVRLLRRSRLYLSPPMRGGRARGWFLNAVVTVETTLAPEALLAWCITLERRAGRRRAHHWGDRTLDLDLLHMEGVTCRRPDLALPHPGIAGRPFVLAPLLEVWPAAHHPVSGVPWSDSATPGGPGAVPVSALALGRVAV